MIRRDRSKIELVGGSGREKKKKKESTGKAKRKISDGEENIAITVCFRVCIRTFT